MLLIIYLNNGTCKIHSGDLVIASVETGLYVYTTKCVFRYDIKDIKRVFSTNK